MKEHAKFCQYCGRQLVKRIFKSGFDKETGKPKYYIKVACPKAYSFFGSYHDEYMPVECEAPHA